MHTPLFETIKRLNATYNLYNSYPIKKFYIKFEVGEATRKGESLWMAMGAGRAGDGRWGRGRGNL